MGWDNPPVPWREFERRLSWRQGDKRGKPSQGARGPGDGEGADGPGGGEGENENEKEDEGRDDLALRPVTRLPVAGQVPAGGRTSSADRDSAGEDSADQDSGGSSPRRQVATGKPVPWAELHCHSAYSFLDGASTPGELIAEAAECGLTAIAITDHDGMYGVPQFAQSAARFRESEEGLGSNVATVFGAELSLDIPPVVTSAIAAAQEPGAGPASGWRAGAHSDEKPPEEGELTGELAGEQAGKLAGKLAAKGRAGGGLARGLPIGTPRAGIPDPMGRHLLVLARDPEGYGRLCRVISAAHLAGGEKGRPVYDLAELAEAHDGHWVILTGCRKGTVPSALAREAGAAGALGTGALGRSASAQAINDAARAELRVDRMFGRDNVMVELINNDQPGDDERNDVLFELARQEPAWSPRTTFIRLPADAKLAQVLAAIARQPGRYGRLAGRVGHRVHQDGDRDGAPVAPLPGGAGADRRTR
jgi:hypothetical protein